MTTIVVDGSAKRAAWRATATVHRAAMRKTLAMIPAGNRTLLEVADEIALSVPMMARIAWQDVTIFERWNDDVQTWAPALIAHVAPSADADLVIDALFRLGQAIDAHQPPGPALSELTALLG